MRRDLASLVAMLKEQVDPVLEQAWAKLVAAYPDRHPSEFATHFSRWTDDMFEVTKKKIPAEESIEYGIMMGAAHAIVRDEFMAKKLPKENHA